MRLTYSTVKSATDKRPARVDSTWRILVRKLARVEPRGKYPLADYLELSTKAKAKAKAGPGWIPGAFKRGGKRLDAHLRALSCFVGDVDNKTGHVTVKDIRRALHGFRAVIHTTYSHSRETPKFRFVVPYAAPIRPQDHARVFHFFNGKLGGALDPKGKTPSQLYYWPSCPPDAVGLFRFEHLEGKPLRLADLPVTPRPVERKPDPEIKLPKKLPKVNLKKLGLSPRIVKLITTGEDPSRKYTSRSEAIFAVVIAMLSCGATDAQAAAVLLNRDYAISEKILEQRNPLRYVKTTLKKARSQGFIGDVKTVENAVAELNAKHAVVTVGGKTLILTEDIDPVLDRRLITFGTIWDLRLVYANRKLMINEKSVCIADIWLQHEDRRQYSQLVFAPNQEMPGYYNLWRGFAIKPKPGDCSLYLAHIRDNIAQGDEHMYRYLIGYMADAVQNPGRLPGVAVVMRGEEGVGKGVFATEFGRLFGQHFIPVSSSRHLVGTFNAHMKDALLVFADEAFWAGDKSSQGVLNAMITEPTRVIEFKGKDPIHVRNYTRLLIASNHEWVVPANLTARRFCVIDVGNQRMQDAAYFSAIRQQMNRGGSEALLHYLMQYDLSAWTPGAFPRTGALFNQQLRSLGPEAKFWFDRLWRGELLDHSGRWDERAKCSTLHSQYIQYSQKAGFARRSAEVELGFALKKLCPTIDRRRRKIDGKRSYYYEFPSLGECRSAFEEVIGSKIDWKIIRLVSREQTKE